ncbi:MAG TPA: protein kinase [Ktedonobacteraceae bacterium]
MNDHLVGRSIKTFFIEELLEQQNIDAIYLARSTVSGHAYYLHTWSLPPMLSPEERLVLLGHFQHKAHELMQILTEDEAIPQHPQLLPVIDAGSLQDTLYIVAPALSKMTLTTLLASQGPMDALTASRYLDQLASALEYAHHHALLHCNLTTDAVWLRQDGSFALADLGVMQILQLCRPDLPPAAFYSARPTATPAPEQLLGQAVHTSTDVYALGALLYQLLTGHPLFHGTSPANMLERHLRAPVPSLAVWRPILVGQMDVTTALDQLLAAALAKDTYQRIQHPAQLANAYHKVVAPHDQVRIPVASPLTEELAAPLPGSVGAATGTRAEQYARRGGSRAIEARRRAILFLGGGAVAVGVLAFAAREVLSKGNSAPSSQTTGSTSIAPATTVVEAPTTSGQATSTAGSPTSVPISGTVIAHASAVPVNSAITFQNPNSNSSQPGVLVHLPNGQFAAFDSTCTHSSSCAVQYVSQDKLLECPCHGATFDPTNHASVVQGPAPTPLAPITITVYPDGTITTK